jgi:hypothetical protein
VDGANGLAAAAATATAAGHNSSLLVHTQLLLDKRAMAECLSTSSTPTALTDKDHAANLLAILLLACQALTL